MNQHVIKLEDSYINVSPESTDKCLCGIKHTIDIPFIHTGTLYCKHCGSSITHLNNGKIYEAGLYPRYYDYYECTMCNKRTIECEGYTINDIEQNPLNYTLSVDI